ncbi:hypothetical protein K491DRAFT_697085 [Lophiostoma macrostomum CBS 122681]|uniref:Uncharacterized protein n=1 Tax=Lophiostoma macrostomum CBS 122681 TaxID=1314788 RepID=A0A6A6SWW6_9PLEO|nr:hypothetical protein K491DRAFT_697085 [Lophiostoma macrostomum CBS 122681]
MLGVMVSITKDGVLFWVYMQVLPTRLRRRPWSFTRFIPLFWPTLTTAQDEPCTYSYPHVRGGRHANVPRLHVFSSPTAAPFSTWKIHHYLFICSLDILYPTLFSIIDSVGVYRSKARVAPYKRCSSLWKWRRRSREEVGLEVGGDEIAGGRAAYGSRLMQPLYSSWGCYVSGRISTEGASHVVWGLTIP